MKDGTIGAATVGRERCSVSKEPSSNRTSNWYRIIAARRIRDDSQSSEMLFQLTAYISSPKQRSMIEHVVARKLCLVSRVTVRVVDVQHHHCVSFFHGKAVAHLI
jgi:hypothetical protein